MQSNITEGKFLHIRLFLEGVEIPVISAITQERLGSPATADIDIPATAAALLLKPRTNVLLFYYEPRQSTYCLMFVGEIIGATYSKSDASRQVTLQCMDHTSYWKIAYAYYFVTGNQSSQQGEDLANLIRQRGIFLQAKAIGLTDTVGTMTIANLLKETPKTPALANITGLVGGLIRILEYLTGELVNSENEFQPLNSFFSYSSLKNRLMQQITALQNDDSAQTLFQIQALTTFLSNGVLSTKDVISFEEIVQYVLGYIFHQHFPVMRPKYVAPELQTRVSVSNTTFDTVIQDLIATVSLMTKRDTTVGLLEGLFSPNNKFAAARTQITATASAAKAIAVNAHLDVAETLADALRQYLSNNKAAAPDTDATVKAQITELSATLKKAFTTGQTDTTQAFRNGNLFTRVFSPNIFFAAPPRCNVIFPEYYNRLSLSRSFTEESTRLDLDSSVLSERLGPGTVPGIEHIYAPSASLPKGAAIINEELIRKTLPHEIHTGIVPRFSSIGDRLELEAAAKQSTPALNVELQKIADFHFFVDRLQPRSMGISGKFNPDLVVGLPCVVLDNANVDPSIETVDDIVENKVILQQFLGVVNDISHQVTQDTGASTQVGLSYVRSHRGEDDEIALAVAQSAAVTALNAQRAQLASEHEDKVIQIEQIKIQSEEAQQAGDLPKSADLGLQYQQQSAQAKTEYEDKLKQLDAQEAQARTVTTGDAWEKTLTPSWISPNYSTSNIGDKFYDHILGIKSITDAVTEEETKLFGGAHLDSVENAVDVLVLKYARQNRSGSTTRFAERYTQRPIATIDEILNKDNGFFGPVFDPNRGLVPAKGTLPIELDSPECYRALAEAAAEVDGRREKLSAIYAYQRSISSRGLRN